MNNPTSIYLMTGILYDKIMVGDRLSCDNILKCVAPYFDVTVEQMKSQCRKENMASARKMFCKICRDVTPMSLHQIGRFLGNRDHSTIINSVKTYDALVINNPYIPYIYQNIKDMLFNRTPRHPDIKYVPHRHLKSHEILRIKRMLASNQLPVEQRETITMLPIISDEMELKPIHVKDEHYSYNREAIYK